MIADEVLDYVRQESAKFDRTISKRNWRECLAAVPVVVVFLLFSQFVDHWITAAGCYCAAASAVWIVFYLVRHGRGPADPDPQQSLASYREALREKFDHQIQLLKAAKYWYILPFYVSFVLLYSGQMLDDLHRKRPSRLAQHHFVDPVHCVLRVGLVAERSPRRCGVAGRARQPGTGPR